MRLINNLKYGAMILAASIIFMGAANDCDGKAAKASYAGDGVTMFVGSDDRACSGNTQFCGLKGSGKLRFGKTYAAHGTKSDRKNCEWSVYTIDTAGRRKVQASGTYKTAKVSAERPTRVHVFLKSEDCGDWKP